MTAVDTNVLVRLLTGDDPSQAAVARSVFAAGRIWISKTVLLETAWVLRSLFDFDEGAVRMAFTGLLGLSGVEVEDEGAVSAALALAVQGVDFADAMHLASRPHGCNFVTFDRAFVRRAKRAGAVGVTALP